MESEGVVDIFKVAGIAGADVSILDDRFLQTFKDLPQENLRLKLLQKLLRDEIQRRQKGQLGQGEVLPRTAGGDAAPDTTTA